MGEEEVAAGVVGVSVGFWVFMVDSVIFGLFEDVVL